MAGPETPAAAPEGAAREGAPRPPGPGPESLEAAFEHGLSLSTRAMHADDYINSHQAVAPPLHVSTTFRYHEDPDKLVFWGQPDPNATYDTHVYSRESAPNTTRMEAILTSAVGAPCLTYSSGLSALHALLTHLNPRRVAIEGGYSGAHGVVALLSRLTGLEALPSLSDESLARLGPGDVVHVETPLNPTGEARDLERLAAAARARGAYLTVDATFAPPPLLDPFRWGADAVVHSGTKYFGGHSDMLCGVLAVAPRWVGRREGGGGGGGGGSRLEAGGWVEQLRADRLVLGSVMGSMEGWLGVRSLRTLELRVERQSASAQRLVDWLVAAAAAGEEGQSSSSSSSSSPVAGLVVQVRHASQQAEAGEAGSWLRRQMPRGFGPVFSVVLDSEDHARRLPSRLRLFHHATSLGGVESLIEWRAMTDPRVDRRLLRVSVGVEAWEDLRADLLQGFRAIVDEDRAKGEGRG
ncbi:hypothetical protein RB595_000495 [Gaeumannomyces hyphopodioides]